MELILVRINVKVHHNQQLQKHNLFAYQTFSVPSINSDTLLSIITLISSFSNNSNKHFRKYHYKLQ